jgi:hypothetical protein
MSVHAQSAPGGGRSEQYSLTKILGYLGTCGCSDGHPKLDRLSAVGIRSRL